MEPQDDYYEEYYGKTGRRKPSPWRYHLLAIALLVAVGLAVIVSGVTDNWLTATSDQEAHSIDVRNLEVLD